MCIKHVMRADNIMYAKHAICLKCMYARKANYVRLINKLVIKIYSL